MVEERTVIVGHKSRTFYWSDHGRVLELPELGYVVPLNEIPTGITVPNNHVLVLVTKVALSGPPSLEHELWEKAECTPVDLRSKFADASR
jgi:hypothetical protein